MGGGGDLHHHGADGDFRSKVWSMTGGPYCRPKHWKRNTAIAMFGIFLVCIPIAMKSAELEDNLPAQQLISEWKLKARKEAGESIYQRPHHPVRPIPSQFWCKNFGKKEY